MTDKQPLIQPKPPPFQGVGYSAPPPAYAPPPVAPPPAYPPAYPPMSDNVVYTHQPTPVVYNQHRGSSDNFLMLSIILSCLCFFCGSWLALVCTIPAIFMAISAQELENRGDFAGMERNRRSALCLNITGLSVGLCVWVVMLIAIIISAATSSDDSGYYDTYQS